jgi:hypothetical protein
MVATPVFGQLGNGGFQSRAQRRSPPQLRGQSFDRSQSGGTNVVFHPLHIVIDHPIIETEKFEEIGKEFMPVCDIAGEHFTGRG